MVPETRYARSGELHIAHQVFGSGRTDLLWVPTWIWQGEHVWAWPGVERLFQRLQGFARVITFDRRGTGMSDPVLSAPTLEEQMDDVVAVLDAVGSERAALFAQLEAGAMACLFAASHPERTGSLILYEATPRTTRTSGYEWPLSSEEREALIESLRRTWGSGETVMALAPSQAGDERLRRWAGRLERLAASPSTAVAFSRMHGEIDVRPVLASIQAPTLVLHRSGDRHIDIRHSRYLAAHIPGARLVELPGEDTLLSIGDPGALLDEVEEFLTGARHSAERDRVLATVMFSDIVESTVRAAQLGDRRWRELLEALRIEVRDLLEEHRGRAVKTMGDGFLATFDGPARAIRCGQAIRTLARERFGLEVRIGLHTGEIELIGDDVGGLAVHIGARIAALAEPGELLVSGTVKDLVVGSGIEFEDRGRRRLKGVPDEWRLWSVPPSRAAATEAQVPAAATGAQVPAAATGAQIPAAATGAQIPAAGSPAP
jgi:class 3 adenylate cyclase